MKSEEEEEEEEIVQTHCYLSLKVNVHLQK